ncbi:MAG: hypothetical protein GXO70_08185 [Acidobacteria bacterium]|nr:hypothetical protein [Acidobacteriota bacterium]
MKTRRTLILACFLLALSLVSFAGSGTKTFIPIHDIQGNGSESPMVGQIVDTGGIVTGLTDKGFFLQTPDADSDSDPLTSEGIYVYTSSAPTVSVGDKMTLTATVSEYYGMTELGSVTNLNVESSGNPLPAPVELDGSFPSPDQPYPGTDLERCEGMRVEIDNGVVCEGNDFHGDVMVAAISTRPAREPGIIYPGETGLPVWDGNPERFQMDPNGLGLAETDITGGTGIVLAVGPLTYSFNRYKLLPDTLQLAENDYPKAVRDRNPGELLIATQNMLNFKSGETNFNVRLSKASLLIRTMLKSPDILCLEEIGSQDAMQQLADRIHNDDSSIHYTIYFGSSGTGSIHNGVMVRDSVQVTAVTEEQVDDTFDVNGSTYTLHDRPPLLVEATATVNGEMQPISVLVLHDRSLNDIDADLGPNPDPDRANFVRTKRQQQAFRISQFMENYQANNPQIPFFVAGDFNAFDFTDGYVDVTGQIKGHPDPLGAMLPATDEVDPDLTDLALLAPISNRYSYVHDGNTQIIDHILASHSARYYVRDVAFAHANADAPASYADDENPDTPVGVSDHDGVVAFLDFYPENVTPAYFAIVPHVDYRPSSGDPSSSFWETVISITDGDNDSANLQVTALDKEGNPVAETGWLTLTNRATVDWNINMIPFDTALTASDYGKIASLKVESTGDFAITERFKAKGIASGLELRTVSAADWANAESQLLTTTAYIGHIDESWQWWTGIAHWTNSPGGELALNFHKFDEDSATDVNTPITLDFLDGSTPIDKVAYVSEDLTGTEDEQWMKITGVNGCKTMNYQLFGVHESGSSLGVMSGLNATSENRLATTFYLPMSHDVDWRGIAILNPGDTAATVTLDMYIDGSNVAFPSKGSKSQLREVTLTVAPQKRVKGVIGDDGNYGLDLSSLVLDITDPAHFTGILKIVSDVPIVTELVQGDNAWSHNEGITGISSFDTGTRLVIPFISDDITSPDGNSHTPHNGIYHLTNVGTESAAITVTLYDMNGNVVAADFLDNVEPLFALESSLSGEKDLNHFSGSMVFESTEPLAGSYVILSSDEANGTLAPDGHFQSAMFKMIPKVGLSYNTITVDSQTRRYALYVPNNSDTSPQSLVFELHGGGVYTEDMTGESGHKTPYKLWMKLADTEKFIVVYPEGLNGSYGSPTWNDCRANSTVSSAADDVEFISALIDKISASYNIDSDRIYVSGTSNGGIMALRLAVELSDRIAAVAAVAAAMPDQSECGPPATPVSVLFMNGTADNHLPYTGGTVGNPPSADHGSVYSTDESVQIWTTLDQTETVPLEYHYPDLDATDGSTVTRYTYSDGVSGTEVILYKITGGGHSAPSIQERYSWLFEYYFGKQNHDIEMVNQVFNFFKTKILHQAE